MQKAGQWMGTAVVPRENSSKGELRHAGQEPHMHTAVRATRREGCGSDLLILSAPGGMIKEVQSEVVSLGPSPVQWSRVHSADCRVI